jgi:hypothetical protein
VIVVLLLTACSAAPQVQATYDPASLRFDGQRAYALEDEFVTKFPNRSSGMPNSQLAVEWLKEQLTASGWECQIDEWQVINFSRPVPMRNVVCKLPRVSPKEIVVAAHHDQSPLTVQGADNDGSGISILIHLGEIFGSEGKPPYTLVFIASDEEEWGMLGSRRYIQTHTNPDDIIAAISLDNLGKYFYNGMDMEVVGQFRKVGALWLQLLAGEAARAAGDLWVPKVRPVMDQVTGQAVPLSFMDQGPYVAAGLPALGFAGANPPELSDLNWQTYHSPQDVMQYQSAEVLYQSGRIPEALIRQLLSMQSFPREAGPYLYFEGSRQVLRGAPLWVPLIGFVALFFLGSYFTGGRNLKEKLRGWRGVLPHFLGLWISLAASVLLLYLLVAVGLMDKYDLYPATTKDPETLNPHWPAVILFLVGMGVFLFLGRRLVRRSAAYPPTPAGGMIKSFGLLVVGLAGIYVLALNPFSLLFFIPLLFWFLIGVRKDAGRILDILFFVLGGLVVYYLFYFFGFIIQHMDFAVLWYMMMMFSIQEVSFLTALAITAIIAAGLAMIVNPPLQAEEKTAVAVSPANV